MFRDVASRCFSVRTLMTARAVTRIYDHALKQVGLTITQFTLLISIGAIENNSISQLGARLNIEKSTLSRNLRPLIEAGLVERDTSPPGRAIVHRLTAKGQDKLRQAYPIWKDIQGQLEDAIGQPEMDAGFGFMSELRKASDARP